MTDPSSSAACEASCVLAGTQVECTLPAGHPYEHEASETVDVTDERNRLNETPFLVWWGNDGHAFVGSDKAVNTGRIA